MTTTIRVLLCLALGGPVAALGGPARAQTPLRGEIAIAFDPAGQHTTIPATSFVPFSIYFLVEGLGELHGWEAGLDHPGTMSILSETYSVPGALTIGRYIVGLGACVDHTEPTVLLRIEAGFLSGLPVGEELLCLGGSTPSSVQPPAPAFVDCGTSVFAMRLANKGGAAYPDGCAVINPTQEPPVASRSSSYGWWKARARP